MSDEKWYDKLNLALVSDLTSGILLGVGSIIGSILTIIFLTMGFIEMASSVKEFFWAASSKTALYKAVSGVEFLLLAPIGYLVPRSLAKYAEGMRDPNGIPEGAKKTLLEIKSLSIGLLFAIIATHYVGIIVGKPEHDKMQFSWNEHIIAGVLMLILGAYFFGLEHFASKHSKRE